MSNSTDTMPTTEGQTSTGISRRTVVRAGATAAWTVPLITVATAAPALAVSGQCKLTMSSFSVSRASGNTRLVAKLGKIRNSGTAKAGAITVTISIPRTPAGSFSATPTLFGTSGAGWKAAGTAHNGSSWNFVFVYAAGLNPRQNTSPLSITLKLANNKLGKTITVSAMAMSSGCGTAALTDTIR